MILVDTSVWIDHLRKGNEALVSALEHDAVSMHPHVIGELALGNLKDRFAILALLRNLPRAVVATDDEVQTMIEEVSLFWARHWLHRRSSFGRSAADPRDKTLDPRQALESCGRRSRVGSAALMPADFDRLLRGAGISLSETGEVGAVVLRAKCLMDGGFHRRDRCRFRFRGAA